MIEIPDIFGGWTVDAGPEPTYEEKMRVPPPPPPPPGPQHTNSSADVLFYNIPPLEAPINLSTCTRHIMTSYISR